MKITVRQQTKAKQVECMPKERGKTLKLLLGSENIFIFVGICIINKVLSD
jgi:hypothetical protein